MIFNFVVPLKSLYLDGIIKGKKIVLNLSRAMLSIDYAAGLTEDYDVNVYISGHENPFLEFPELIPKLSNIKVIFVNNYFSAPSSSDEYMKDKRNKKLSAFNRIFDDTDWRVHDYVYLMHFDADDVVAKSFFVDFFDEAKDLSVDDYCLVSGFAFDVINKNLGYVDGRDRLFYKNCGSSYICKVRKKDFGEGEILHKLKNHVRYPSVAEKNFRKVRYISEPLVTYLVNHGENDVSLRHGDKRMVNFVKRIECSDEKKKFFFSENYSHLL